MRACGLRSRSASEHLAYTRWARALRKDGIGESADWLSPKHWSDSLRSAQGRAPRRRPRSTGAYHETKIRAQTTERPGRLPARVQPWPTVCDNESAQVSKS